MKSMEETIFARKRWAKKKMIAYGFQNIDGIYRLEKSFLDGAFKAVLSITPTGWTSKVIDQETQDDYYQLHQENATGAYVTSVRAAYTSLLQEIAAACCDDVLFASPQANRLTEMIEKSFQVQPDFPWDHSTPYQSYGTFRHASNRKWFALIMNIERGRLDKDGNKERIDVINLKIQPNQSAVLHQVPGIYPAYHMNHKTWISVILNDLLPDEKIMALIHDSYQLTN